MPNLRKWSILSIPIILLVNGCADRPEDIEAAYVSPLQYQNYNCDQMSTEYARLTSEVTAITQQQDKTADKDAVAMGVGLILFWPALFFLAAGDDREEEIARLKGEYEALENIAIQKECGIAAEIEEQRRLAKEAEEKKAEEITGPTYLGAGQTTK